MCEEIEEEHKILATRIGVVHSQLTAIWNRMTIAAAAAAEFCASNASNNDAGRTLPQNALRESDRDLGSVDEHLAALKILACLLLL
jgi:hypothetical protein